MPSTYSTNLKITLMATGENSGTWGTITNTNLGTLLEQAICGAATVAMADTNQTISISDGISSDGRAVFISCTGALTAGRNLVVPTLNKNYIVENATTGGFDITVKTTAGTGIAVKPSTKRMVYADGTNVVEALSGFGNTTVTGTLAVSGAVTGGTYNKVTVTAPASGSTLTLADGKTLTASNTLTFTGTDGSSAAFGTGGSVFTKVYRQVFTGSGTYTPHAGIIFADIICVGGGGGGGGAIMGGAGSVTAGGGGGSGGYSQIIKTAAQIGASQTVTVGSGGTGGNPGGETSVGTLCIAKGGSAGAVGSAGAAGAGGAGGSTTGATGDVTSAGNYGEGGMSASIVTVGYRTTIGGVGPFGGGCAQSNSPNSNGQSATGYGSGGGGAYGYNSAVSLNGGNGSDGIVVIIEYCNQ